MFLYFIKVYLVLILFFLSSELMEIFWGKGQNMKEPHHNHKKDARKATNKQKTTSRPSDYMLEDNPTMHGSICCLIFLQMAHWVTWFTNGSLGHLVYGKSICHDKLIKALQR